MSQSLTVAAVQIAPVLGDSRTNAGNCLLRLHECADRGVDLVVFPECCLTGYAYDSLDEVRSAAEKVSGETVQSLVEVCRSRRIGAVVGFLEMDDDRVYNTVALIEPDGGMTTYRKTHLPLLGGDRFVCPGQGPLSVADTIWGRVGLLVCYDMRFPEPARVLALLGAQVILQPTNLPRGGEAHADFILRTRACENRVWVVSANRVGTDAGFTFIGRSQIIAPTGEVVAEASATEEEVIAATIDLSLASQKDLVNAPGSYEMHLMADRRPELYSPICGGEGESGARP